MINLILINFLSHSLVTISFIFDDIVRVVNWGTEIQFHRFRSRGVILPPVSCSGWRYQPRTRDQGPD